MRTQILSASFLLIWILTSCSTPTAVPLSTPLPSPAVISETPPVAATQTSVPLSTPSATAASTAVPALTFDCQSVHEIPLEECQALVALYESTGGPQWEDSTGWLVTSTPCSWDAVLCQDGHVVELQLFYNNLNGTLPAEIGKLTFLNNLYLDRNQLSGPLPPEFGDLTNLVLARLGGNQFTALPPEIGKLTHLATLELWGNPLGGEILADLAKLSTLQELRLSSSQLTGSLPPSLGDLGNLQVLDLSHNQLSGSIPAELAKLYSLNMLDLSDNQFTGSIPPGLEDLVTGLSWLDLSFNQLTGPVPPAIAQAPGLERRLWGNRLDGTVFAAQEMTTTVEYQGVRFAFHSDLAESVWPEIVSADPPVDGEIRWDASPQNTRFTFASHSDPGSSKIWRGSELSRQPQISVYPLAEYRALSEQAGVQIDALQALLSTKPQAPGEEIPFLPRINAAQVFHAKVRYLNFQNGSGLRFITHYSQEAIPVINQSIFYTFQGISADGAWYISAVFPVSAPFLPDQVELNAEESNSIAKNYAAYLSGIVEQLEGLLDAEYRPDLALLDEIIQSLTVK